MPTPPTPPPSPGLSLRVQLGLLGLVVVMLVAAAWFESRGAITATVVVAFAAAVVCRFGVDDEDEDG